MEKTSSNDQKFTEEAKTNSAEVSSAVPSKLDSTEPKEEEKAGDDVRVSDKLEAPTKTTAKAKAGTSSDDPSSKAEGPPPLEPGMTKSAMNTYNIDPSEVYVMGFSMGGEGTWHIAGRHQDLFTGAIPVAAPVSGPTKWKIPVYVIHSKQDDIVLHSPAKKHADQVKAAGGTIHFETLEGLSHYESGRYGAHVAEGVRWIRAQK